MKNNQKGQDLILRIDDEVLAFKKRVDEAKSVIDRIQSAIKDCRSSINQAQSTIPVMPDRKQARSDIMADIALGNATHDALSAIDEQISNETALTESAKQKVAQAIADHQTTLDGLLNKLEIAQHTLAEIEGQTDAVARRYFEELAEIAAEQYANQAIALKELYLKLAGLSLALKAHGGRNLLLSGVDSIKIPKFNLPQFKCVVIVDPSVKTIMHRV